MPNKKTWEEEFDEKFPPLIDESIYGRAVSTVFPVLSNTQRIAVKLFISNLLASKDQEIKQAYEKGQDDAFNGRIEKMETLTIKELVDIPQELKDYIAKQAKEEAYLQGVSDEYNKMSKCGTCGAPLSRDCEGCKRNWAS